MKKLYYAITVLFLITVIGCKKSTIATDNGCITRINSLPLTNVDTAGAIKLFNDDGLSTEHLTFVHVLLNDVITGLNGTTVNQDIFAMQHYNGLPLFTDNIGYHFINRVFDYKNGTIYGAINLSTTPKLTLPQLRALYINAAVKNEVTANFRDTCLVATLGYYNLNSGTGNATPNFAKAWYVRPQNAPYPAAYINDDNNTTIAFLNGVVYFGNIN